MSFFRSRGVLNKDYKSWVMEQMATVRNDTPLRDVLKDITRPFTLQGHRVRALDITGKDRELLLALVDPQYTVCDITNKRLQETLRASPWAKGRTDKQLSARLRWIRH